MRWRLAHHVVAASVSIALAGFIVWARRDPIAMIEVELTQKVRPGEMVTERAAVIRIRKDCRSTISAEIIDSRGLIHRVEPVNTQLPVTTGTVNIDRNYPVPLSAAWGWGKLVVQRTYYCWPFFEAWPIVNPRREMAFEIAP